MWFPVAEWWFRLRTAVSDLLYLPTFLTKFDLFDRRRGRCKLPPSVQHASGLSFLQLSTSSNAANIYQSSPTYEEVGEPGRNMSSTSSGRNASVNQYELATAISEPAYAQVKPSAPPPIYSTLNRPAPSSSSAAAAAVVNDPTYNNTTTTLIDNTLYGVQQQIPMTSSNVADNDITLIDNDLYKR